MSLSHPSSVGPSDLVTRVKGLLTDPKHEWDKIEAEPATIGGLYSGYALLLAAIPPAAQFIHGVVFGYGAFGISIHPSLVAALVQAMAWYAFSLVVIYLIALIIDALAPNFGGEKNQIQAFKVTVYSYTAAWVTGVFAVLPVLGIIAFLGGLYSLYLLYLGLPRLMKAPQDQALGYTAVSVVCAIVLFIVVGVAVGAAMAPFGMMGGGMLRPGHVAGTMRLPGGGSVNLDQLDAASKQAELAAAQIKAEQTGKPAPAGAIKAVAPDTLKALLPDSVASYARTGITAESAGTAAMSSSHASADYAKGDSRISLEVQDLATAGALAAMTGAFNIQTSRDTPTGYSKIGKVDGRMTSEEFDRSSNHGKYSVVVADRFVVQAEGDHVSMDQLKGAVSSVGFNRLEGLAHNG